MTAASESFDAEALDEILARYHDVDGALLPILHAVQDRFGYVPPQAVSAIAKFLRATAPLIYAVITFYSEFRTAPRGDTVVGVCRGPACRLLGALELQERLERRLGVRAGESTADGNVTLEAVACLGICGLAPAIEVGHEMIGRADEVVAGCPDEDLIERLAQAVRIEIDQQDELDCIED